MSGINKTGSNTTRPVPQPQKHQGSLRNKTSLGTLRTAASLTGPAERPNMINADAQSQRSNQATYGNNDARAEETRSRIISRDNLNPDADVLYGGGPRPA